MTAMAVIFERPSSSNEVPDEAWWRSRVHDIDKCFMIDRMRDELFQDAELVLDDKRVCRVVERWRAVTAPDDESITKTEDNYWITRVICIELFHATVDDAEFSQWASADANSLGQEMGVADHALHHDGAQFGLRTMSRVTLPDRVPSSAAPCT
ncbi:hypothetical protein BDN72DRAFT_927362 [Pluteus cervinus]|uniref:Uncharacterized protein n=1 Tax=Pluteus cervinus TaxID=181527 RepID=A0ACD3ADQ5_9AGAR|nr:hypothetical protein BDN72DRAFT_927362 [Pluteus cervinus]